VRGRLQGEVLDARGTTRPLERERQEELDRLLDTVAHVPGAMLWPKERPFSWMSFAGPESVLLGWLAKSPALWVPVERELTQRLAAHEESEWWRLGLTIYAHSKTAAAELAAQRLWRRMPERFDTDALMACAERRVEPFLTEYLALEARLP